MKRLLLALAVILFWVWPAMADVDPIPPISVTSTAGATQINATKGYILINDGPAEVFWDCDADAASTSNSGLKSTDPPFNAAGESCNSLKYVTSAGTATLRVFVLT